jgi:hypothetical protein
MLAIGCIDVYLLLVWRWCLWRIYLRQRTLNGRLVARWSLQNGEAFTAVYPVRFTDYGVCSISCGTIVQHPNSCRMQKAIQTSKLYQTSLPGSETTSPEREDWYAIMCYGWNVGQEVAVMGYWLELQLDIHFDTNKNRIQIAKATWTPPPSSPVHHK